MVEPMFAKDFPNSTPLDSLIELTGSEAKHAISVRRMRVGEAIQLTNGLGLRAKGKVDSIAGNSLWVRVSEIVADEIPKIQLTLVQALAKGDRDELAIQAATELGVTSVVPWEADRSISRWVGLKESKGVERWKTIVSEAAKQSLSSFHPSVSMPVKGTEVSRLVAEFDLVLVLDPTSAKGLAQLDFPNEGKIALVVGPEGGISEPELAALENRGAIRVNLGSQILRTSTAGIAAISGILAITGSWGSK